MDLGAGQGELILILTAYDEKHNNGYAEREFYVDNEYPEITETSVGEAGVTTKNAVKLSGLIYDSNDLNDASALKITASGYTGVTLGKTDLTLVTDSNKAGYGASEDSRVASGKLYHWETTIQPGSSVGQLADGRYSSI